MVRAPLLVIVIAVGLVADTHRTAARGVSSPEAVEVHMVRLPDIDREFGFEPAELEIRAGTTVRWVNDDDVYHTVTTSDSATRLAPNGLVRGRLSRAGDVVEFTFDQPGVYAYYCQPHSDFMTGIVHVIAMDESDQAPPNEVDQ